MKAVNLLPADRHDAKKGSGRSGPPEAPDRLRGRRRRADRRPLVHGLVVGLVGQQEAEQLAALQAQIADDSGPERRRRRRPARGRRPWSGSSRPARLGSVPRHALEGHARGRLAEEPRSRRRPAPPPPSPPTRRPRPRRRLTTRRRPRPRRTTTPAPPRTTSSEHVHDLRLHLLAAVGRADDAPPRPRPVAHRRHARLELEDDRRHGHARIQFTVKASVISPPVTP